MQYTTTSWRVGPCTPVSLEETMVVEAAGVSGFMPTAAVNFKRLQLKECLLHSKQYTRSQKMNNYTISFKDNQTASTVVEKFGTIETFLDISNADTGQRAVFAIVNEFTTTPLVCSGITLKHMLLATESRSRVIPVSWILNKCISITVNGKRFVVKHEMYMSLSC